MPSGLYSMVCMSQKLIFREPLAPKPMNLYIAA